MAGKKKEEKEIIRPLVGDALDYSVYYPSVLEKIGWFLVGAVAGAVVMYIFLESIVASCITGIVTGLIFIPMRRNQIIEKRKKQLLTQFRSLLDALSTSVGAGKNITDAFLSAESDLAVQYSTDSYIVNEIRCIGLGLNNNIQIENLLMNFAERSGLDDVESFANVFATCYKKGANIQEVIKNTAAIIGDKIEIQMELETMVAGQKNEQNIMLVMPVVFIVAMKAMGGDMIDLSTPTGVISVTIALVIFAVAYLVSRKILDIKL